MPRPTEISDLVAYLAHSDLLTAGFKCFENRPYTYVSWGGSMFQNTIEGLNLEASEELGLHTKWL